MSTTGCDARDARSPLASPFALRYRLWRLPFSQRERLAPAVGCPKGCREKTRSKRSHAVGAASRREGFTQLYQTLLRSLSASHFYVKVCHDSMDTPQKNYLVNAYEP